MEIIGYRSEPGAPFGNKEANEVGEFLFGLYQEMGMLSPEILVDVVQHNDTPINKYFTWDVIEGMKKLHLQEARQILNHINVIIKNGSEVEVRAFHRITVMVNRDKEEVPMKVYMPTINILASEPQSKEVVQDVIKMLLDIVDKYEPYEELAPVFKAIRRAIKKHGLS